MILTRFIFLGLLVTVVTVLDAQSIYDLSFRDIDGDTVKMDQFAGRKLLVMVVPGTKVDSIYSQLSLFKKRVGDSVNILLIPSREAGYNEKKSSSTREAYSVLQVKVSDGLMTRKGAAQAELLQWLTDRNKNHHYNNEIQAPGAKFFINEIGRLYAQFDHRTSLQSPIIERVLAAVVSARK